MTDFLIDTIDLADFAAERDDAIDLSAADINAAQQLSLSAAPPAQWSAYLNQLAARGFTQWLAARAPEMAVRQLTANTWQIDGFRVCAIAAPEEDEILLPQAALDQMPCHLYVAVGVHEEYGQVWIAASIRYDQLQSRSLVTEDQAYRVPLAQMSLDSNQLLLTLRCAEPSLIPLSGSVSASVAALQQQANATRMRVGQWLNRKLDDLAAELSWVLLPPLPQTVGLRSVAAPTSPEAMLAQVVQTVTQQGIEVPENCQSAYFDLPTRDPALRLYVVIGQVNPMEWSMLVILGKPDGDALPANLQLSVSDGENVLVQQQIDVARSQSYLYTQLIGEMHEAFQVTITLPDETVYTLPEFVFQ